MIYSERVKKACQIMFEAHKNDVDKGGYPYVFHPFFLATQMDDEASACVALLHDVVEDHGDIYTLEYLRKEGFTDSELEALALLTHDEATPYMDYIKEIASNPLARKVKLADLAHNTDANRLNGRRFKKYPLYKEAMEYLRNKQEEEV